MLTEQTKRCPSCGAEVRFPRDIPLTTEALVAIQRQVFGHDTPLEGDTLGIARAVELAHGIGQMWRIG